MKSSKVPILLIVLGLTGSLLGPIGTVIGMVRAFGTIQDGGPATTEQLAPHIDFAMWTTEIGLLISPVASVFLMVGVIWLIKINRKNKTSNKEMQAIDANAPTA